MIKCDIIILCCNQLHYIKILLKSVFRYTDVDSRLIIVDNASSQDVKDYLNNLKPRRQIREISLILNEKNEGAVRARNQALKISHADFVCFMDNDIEVTPGWLGRMIALMEREKSIGMLEADSNTFGTLPAKGVSPKDYAMTIRHLMYSYAEVGQCATFCALTKREVMDKVGVFDEGYEVIMYEDTDYSRRVLQAGYICALTRGAYVWHYEHKTSAKIKSLRQITERNRIRYFQKWGRPLRIVYILNKNAPLNSLNKAYLFSKELSRKGNFVYLFFNNISQQINPNDFIRKFNIVKHLNIQLLFFKGRFFNAFCLWRILKKTKKKYNLIILEDKRLKPFLNFFRPLHRSRVIDEECIRSGI